jgi:DNA-binding winged helix-turn-helix (wHTH) protein
LIRLPRNDVATYEKEQPSYGEIIEFGPFRLRAAQRLLERDGAPVSLGSRALDILIALVERPTEVITKRDLIGRVWPDLVVEEGSLRFHIAVLRKALGDGQAGARYVSNVAGRGYCFVAPISRTVAEAPVDKIARLRPTHLPAYPSQLLGRDEVMQELSDRLRSHRLVSVVGSGGTGKTSVAVSVADRMRQEFHGAVYFLKLAEVTDPLLACRALALAVGIAVSKDAWLLNLLHLFKDRRVLLVLDSCEHMVEALAALVELLLRATLHVHMLTTSQQPLRVEGEQILQLPPLNRPPADLPSV